jgi:hypothetical protein
MYVLTHPYLSFCNFELFLHINLYAGLVRFDSLGIRSEFELDLLNVHEGPGIVKVRLVVHMLILPKYLPKKGECSAK